MTSSLVKLVLTLGLGLYCLQGILCRDINFDKVQQSETQNETLETKIETAVAEMEELVTPPPKKDRRRNLLVSIAAIITDISKAVDDIHNAVVPPTCDNAPTSSDRPIITLASGITVVCDTTTDNGGWVVFQRRTSDGVNFWQYWQQYKDGFGDKPNNFWLGLEAIHQLTSDGDFELRVDLQYNSQNYYAQYDVFRVLGEGENYKLVVSGYHGDAGDALAWHNGSEFSTRDRDNDRWGGGSCASAGLGAWWYNGLSEYCHASNLNGKWDRQDFNGLNWEQLTGTWDSVSFSEMKFRPRRS